MPDTPYIRLHLWDSVGLGLIFQAKTGVLYTHQTGGTLCQHPSVEGAYMPLCNDYTIPEMRFMSPELALSRLFTGPKYGGSGAIHGLDEDDADAIDAVLLAHQLVIAVNRDLLSSSHESWVHVNVGEDDQPERWSGLPSATQAILTGATATSTTGQHAHCLEGLGTAD